MRGVWIGGEGEGVARGGTTTHYKAAKQVHLAVY